MSVLQGVATVLWADAGFKAASPGGIAAVLAPENPTALPVTTYAVVGGSSEPTFETSGMQKLRVQFDFRGVDYASVDAARSALVKVLNGYFGPLSDGTYLQLADLIGPLDGFDNQPRQFRCAVEFYLLFCFS